MGKYMTKKEVESWFKEDFRALLLRNDIPAKRMAWNDYVDMLQKEGRISKEKAASWTQPKFVNK